ncbi:MAG: twin-arginine translocation signal domain-containing protein [Planctomycetaceae bacterium]
MTSAPNHYSRISRRNFLKTSAVATAGTFAAPAFLRGQNLNEKLDIAVIVSGDGERGTCRVSIAEHRCFV